MHYYAIDSGTTHSRIWLMKDQQVLQFLKIPVGVRNTAIDGNNRALMEGLSRGIEQIQKSVSPPPTPQLVIAAGMITSSLGLCEVKHLPAPAGADELAGGIEVRSFPAFGGLPMLFIPGVRSGPIRTEFENANEVDIMRGEETEVVGCLCETDIRGPLLYIHLGSHTKFIRVDQSNRIVGSLSTLAGELIAAVQKDSVLRDSLPPDLNITFDEKSLFQGWMACRKFGLSRALYLVRVLHLGSEYPKEWLASYLVGATLSEDFRCLDSLRAQFHPKELIVSGLPHLHPAWSSFLKPLDLPYRMLSAYETEQAFLKGARHILSLATQPLNIISN